MLNIGHLTVSAVLSAALISCSFIDEDLSQCGEQVRTDYELTLVTNMTTEIQTELQTDAETAVSQELQTFLDGIFTDYAHDVDLSFYDTEGDSVRLRHEDHVMDANQASYTLNLPTHDYMHLAVANLDDNEQVELVGDERCHQAQLRQVPGDTINSHATGLFTARQQMNVNNGENQQFDVHLYMANSAVALVIEPDGFTADGVQVYCTGFATGFSVCDSVYHFSEPSPIVRTTRLTNTRNDLLCYAAVTFPSRQEPSADGKPFWEFRVYVPKPDGTVTENIIGVYEPLLPGELKIVKVKLTADGSVQSSSPEVGVSVTLDWKPGGTYYPNI